MGIDHTGAVEDEAERAGRGDRRRTRKRAGRSKFNPFERALPERASRPRKTLYPDGSTIGRGSDVCTIAELDHARRAATDAVEVCMAVDGPGDDDRGLRPDTDNPQHPSPQSRHTPQRRGAGGVDVEDERRIVCDHETQSRRAAKGHAVQRRWLAIRSNR
jgi:hypothetical protein